MDKENRKNGPDIELFGQRVNYPKTWQGVVAVIFTTVLIICVTFIALVQSRPENLKTIGVITGQLEIDSERKTVEQRTWFRFEFWTPSIDTRDGLAEYLNAHPKKYPDYEWQIHNKKTNNIKEKNIAFGKVLMADRLIDGYRRYPVYGEGSSGRKNGWWWVVGVKGDYSENFFQWFAKTYKEFWGIPEHANSHVEITALSCAR